LQDESGTESTYNQITNNIAYSGQGNTPIRVKTDANDRRQMSVGGLTFMRNQVPDLTLVEEGKYLSKLFAGPNQRLKRNLPALSLDNYRDGLGMDAKVAPEAAYLQGGLRDRMPLPSMMLGYIGEKGTDVQTVVDTMLRGRQSDHRFPRSGIYFVKSDDVRSTCREWQYDPAVQELEQRKVSATITTNFPEKAENVMGLLMGAEKVDPSMISSFAPGAMAEHLTSWSAEFQRPQTKATEWLKAGASGTAGSVVEPYSNPNKFPSARFFVHYASGCTMLESFYQSIACPLQILLLGDPLAQPYAVPLTVKVLGAKTISTDFTFITKAESPLEGFELEYSFLLDGQVIQSFSTDPACGVKAMRLADGYHELRAVARVKHLVTMGSSHDRPFRVNRLGRSVEILPKVVQIAKFKHGFTVRIDGEEMPEKIRLVSGAMRLDEKDYAPDAQLVLDELKLGEGPHRVRAIAVYADGMEVSSTPLNFGITFAEKP